MNIETEMNPTYVIRISHAEAVQAAADPGELQQLLNAALGYKARRAETRRARQPKPRPAAAAPSKKASNGQRCPKCKKIFKRLGRHASTCSGKVDQFDAAMASLDDA